ncbi:hypothetical protein A1Q1_02219 [Trichosporon asahii var. asahii CBS 2479]|uniref:MD-2-related lipid-recognition domain-containing protein n=1 Tax=Trichosporon asahii var. asahii (strain ATCC 90039 / CBS 2479 / JCM 2466 / KCTC 7840 / NBRC 103889/ NCYC 2677 / UAMH 7654) TaxID=1186058 RepID=J5QRN6_TRIAS|nr:hypothetical protein A1Q1_02219 [Trichosporon asahii var. asahii CBS 2479]EJT48753.1 hypothetical protein A1Q1_02219 [Trichosporon asahii var. asahii CBS 2479]
MRIAALALLPLLAVPAAADLAQDAFQWAADIIDGNSAPAPKSDDVHIMNGWKYSDCGLPTDAITLESIELSPDPPQAGKNLTVTVRGRANEKIEEGAYADVTVKLGLIKLIQKRFDVCEEAAPSRRATTPSSRRSPSPRRSPRQVSIILRVTRRSSYRGRNSGPRRERHSSTVEIAFRVSHLADFFGGRANVSAKFVVNVRGYTADDDDMVCLDLAVDFTNPDKFW